MPRPRKKKSKIYFGSAAQEAIIEYNASTSEKERNIIYKERIKYPFEKLAENILNTFKFSYFDIPKEDVKKEVVSVLIEKIHMYKPDKGRAFSYFSIVAKNHLILSNNSNYKRYKKLIYYHKCHKLGILKMISIKKKRVMSLMNLKILC